MALYSPEFLLGFLPVVAAVTIFLRRTNRLRGAVHWLIAASLLFYGFSRPVSLLILLASIGFNFLCGKEVMKQRGKGWLIIGIAGNLLLLGTFKYAAFFAGIVGMDQQMPPIALPLAISFFSFTQIGYLVDAYRGKVERHTAREYALFVLFFPNLLAGPIARYGELTPQFTQRSPSPVSENLAVGLTMVIIGLCKKVVIADSIAAYANLVFDGAASGTVPMFAEAWIGALAYTFQLYFDFSGYSDMAIGIARMMGITLPVNFNAPYRSHSIREFWRRWHMTLSRFIQEYVYIPLGGSRKGELRTLTNLVLTMLLAGLWHGAGWTFVLWGGLHGIYLVIHRLWTKTGVTMAGCIALPLTFLAIVVGWVLFRADSLTTAITLLESMAGMNGFAWTFSGSALASPIVWKRAVQMIAAIAMLVLIAPTTQSLLGIDEGKRDVLTLPLRWKPNAFFALCSAALAMASITVLFLSREHVFLYFQF